MQVSVTYQDKQATLEAPETPYGDNLPMLVETLRLSLAGVGLVLDGTVRVNSHDN